MRSFKLVTEAKHCIRQSVLQAEPNAILYNYIGLAVCWLVYGCNTKMIFAVLKF